MANHVSQVFSVFISMALLTVLGACGESKSSGSTPVALAPITESSSDASSSGDAKAAADECEKESKEVEDEDDEIEVVTEEGIALKKDKAKKKKQDCIPSTDAGSTSAAAG